MARYARSFKIEVARAYLSTGIGARSLAKRYGLDHGTVRFWAEQYRIHGEAGLSKKSARYSADFKMSVLNHMWKEELSCRQVAALFDLRGGHGVVTRWERQYNEGGLDALKPKVRGCREMTGIPKPTIVHPVLNDDVRTLEQIRKENEYLRAEVAYLKKLDALVQAQKSVAQKRRV